MNPVLDAITRRYSCRAFTPEPVSPEDLDALALAAVQAPSSRGRAPWQIRVVVDPVLLEDISDGALNLLRRIEPEEAEDIAAGGTNLFYNAPAVFIIAARRTWDYTSEDLDVGLVAENIALAATGLGLGSILCGDTTQAFRDPKADPSPLYERLGVPREFDVRLGVGIGHPAEDGTPHTPDLSKVRFLG